MTDLIERAKAALEGATMPTQFNGYEVDSDGNVWSTIPWRGTTRRKLTPHPNSHGYPAVKVKTDHGVKKMLVHVQVCLAFHGPKPSTKHQVRHLNGDRSDNRACNLAWGTVAENAQDREQHGTSASANNGRLGAKLSDDDVRHIRSRLARGESARRIAGDFRHVSYQTIKDAAYRKSYRHVS